MSHCELIDSKGVYAGAIVQYVYFDVLGFQDLGLRDAGLELWI